MIGELQKKVSQLDVKFNWTRDKPYQIVLHMQEELGEISRIILKKEGYKKPFSIGNLKKMMRNTELVNYNETFKIPLNCTFFDAGHIPGHHPEWFLLLPPLSQTAGSFPH